MSTAYPIFLDLESRHVLVVGGGRVAARKVSRLLECGARVSLVAEDCCEALRERIARGELEYRPGCFRESDLDAQALVFAATNDPESNARIALLARQRGRLVNVADAPELCDFITPSVIRREPVQIAISTGGASPVLSRLLRSRLEALIPRSFGRLAALMADFRHKVHARISDSVQRRRFWERALDGAVAELLYAGHEQQAFRELETLLSGTPGEAAPIGEVYLVGAGPGDPDLLTFRALRLMQQTDVVVYDRLVAPAILELVRQDAERIYAGKERAMHSLPQEQINTLLVRLAREGKRVLRLKGGDPFIFGRGGEEIETLTEEGIPFQVVPGITAASGSASYAGIPLTHRDHAQACLFVTGHLKDGSMDLNWDALVQPAQTIVVYMGLQALPVLCQELIARGLPASRPAALVQQATTENQRVLCGTLATLPDIVAAADVQPPSLLIIGDVVRLQEKLAWFHPAPAKPGSASAAS